MSRLENLFCAFVFFVCAVVAACPKPAPTPVVVDASDGAVAACGAGDQACQVHAYCQHMRALGCPEAKDTALGASCEVVTANVQRKDIIAMDLACRTARAGCDPGSCR